MTKEELVPAIVDNFCECLVAQLDDILHYTISTCGSYPTTLVCKDSLIQLIQDIKEDYHNETEIPMILEELKDKCECDNCFHNCGIWCDFEGHCKKKFMETDAETDNRLTKEDFVERFCHNCGSQRCEGIGTVWFEGCIHKEHLKDYEKFYG